MCIGMQIALTVCTAAGVCKAKFTCRKEIALAAGHCGDDAENNWPAIPATLFLVAQNSKGFFEYVIATSTSMGVGWCHTSGA